jgi:hypothetical protein
MRILQAFCIPAVFAVFSSCSLFHFFNPGTQNNIQQIADTKGWIQIGQPIPNAAQYSGDFSFDLGPGGIPYVAARNVNSNIIFYRFDGSWVDINSLNNMGAIARPILHFVNGIPYVAMRLQSLQGIIYNFNINPAMPASWISFGGGFLLYDVQNNHSGTFYAVWETNAGSYGINMSFASNDGAWYTPPGYIFSFYSSPITFLKLGFSADNHPYLLWSTNNSFNLIYRMNSFGWTNANFGSTGYYFNYGITPDNKMFLIHQSNTNAVYYEIVDLSMGVNPALYSKQLYYGMVLDYSPQSVVASKKNPSACYIVLNKPFMNTHYVIKLNSDGTSEMTPDIPAMENSAERKLYAAPDGSIYLLFTKGWDIYVYKLIE